LLSAENSAGEGFAVRVMQKIMDSNKQHPGKLYLIIQVLIGQVEFNAGLNQIELRECVATVDSLIVESCNVGEENDIDIKWSKRSSYSYLYDISGKENRKIILLKNK
jgi:hypothetical protein